MSPVPVLQVILTAAACVGLWRLARTLPRIAVAGFLLRAFLGQALFWISYLRLPIARSLQSGHGFWFFAVDGPFYLRHAKTLAASGPLAIVLIRDEYPSRFFVQVLSLFVTAFGGVAPVAILLNCAAYVLICAILLRFRPTNVTLAAIAFSPAFLLFSMQPLKDALFLLLMIALIAAFRRWEELWRAGGDRRRFLLCAATILAVTYALAGIRWYFAAIVWGCSTAFWMLAAWPVRRRAWAFAANAVLFVVLAQAVHFGALGDIPPLFVRVLDPFSALRAQPETVTTYVGEVRAGFDSTPGATTIEAGSAFAPRHTASRRRAPVPQIEPEPPSAPIAPEPAPAVPAPAAPSTPWFVPRTFFARVTTGLAAMFLPRIAGEALGLVHIGGGRGLWLFAELDTIAFDLVLLYAIVHCTRSLRGGRAALTATFVLCVAVFVMTAGPMLYTVSNFGTLFRLRLMLYFLAAVAPVTLRTNE
jgi:hypothetical protein